jgi:amino acid adenylation domain-containing protein
MDGQVSKNVESIYPLSPIQHGMLYHSLLAPRSGVYVPQSVLELTGKLNVNAWIEAWQALIDRHAVFRTLFVRLTEEKPLQVVMKHASLPFRQLDWRARSDREAAFDELLHEEWTCPFELIRPPLMRLVLIHWEDEVYRFVWTHHHALSDGWSTPIIFRELFTMYTAACSGSKAELPPPVPYRAYIQWLSRQNIQDAEKFWAGYLDGSSGATDLAYARMQVAHAPEQAAKSDYEWLADEEVGTAMKSAARRAHVTLNVAMQALWGLLLARLNGCEEVLFGATVAGRPPDVLGVENIVGQFINSVPVRLKVRGCQPVSEWLRGFQQSQGARDRYAYLSLVDIKRVAGMSVTDAPFHSLVVFENYPIERGAGGAHSLPSLQVRILSSVSQNNYPLSLVVFPEERLRIKYKFDPACLERQAVERIARCYAGLLRAFVDSEQACVSDLVARDPERQFRLMRGRAGAPLVERWRSVVELFEGAVDVHGKQTAIEDEQGTLSYSQLDHEANRLARYLQSVGVERGDAVPIVLGRTREQIVSVLAVLKCGACYVPVDPQHTPAARLALMLQDCAARVVLSSSEHMSLLVQAQWEGDLIVLDRDAPEIARGSSARLSAHEHDKACNVPGAVQTGELGETRAASRCSLASAPEPVRVDAQSVAYVIYTSGSTGAPKGVEITHRSVHNYVAGIEQRLGLTADAHLAALSTVGADLGYTALYGALCTGRTLRVIPERLNLDAHGLSRLLRAQPLSALKIVPSHLRALLQACGPEAASWLPQVVILGGERLERSLIEQIRALKPNCRIFNHYGPTETTIGVLCGEVQPAAALSPVSLGAAGVLQGASMEPPSAADAAVALGTPLPGIEVHVLDRFLEPVLPGATGELYIGGAALAQGYLRNARASAERFIANPHAQQAGERLYRTGDRVRLGITGALQFVGRSDDQVKIRGHRVELAEIAAVLRTAPGVHDAAVLVHEARLQAFVATGAPSAGASAEALSTDDRAQESRVRAFVSAGAPHASASADVLSIDDRARESHALALVPTGVPSVGTSREALSEHPAHEARVNTVAASAPSAGPRAEALTIEQLAHYLAERLPEAMRPERIVLLQALPLTGNGKLDRKALAQLAAEQEKTQSRSVHAPRDATENTLAEIWRALLKREQIGIHDNFFDCGGNSLLLIQVHAAIRRQLACELNVVDLFHYPTIAQLAAYIQQTAAPPKEVASIIDSAALLKRQQLAQAAKREKMLSKRRSDASSSAL